MTTIKDHYKTLGVTWDATHQEIIKARNRMLKRHHPDLNPSRTQEAKEITIGIILASEVLLNEKTRAEYDISHANIFRSPLRPKKPKPRKESPPPFEEDPSQIIVCPACQRKNIVSNRNYCIFCGAGIGHNPQPFTSQPQGPEFFSGQGHAVLDNRRTFILIISVILFATFIGIVVAIRKYAFSNIELGSSEHAFFLWGVFATFMLGAAAIIVFRTFRPPD